MGYWLGHFLSEPFPELKDQGPGAMLLPLQEGLMRQEYEPRKLDQVTTKNIYEGGAAYVITNTENTRQVSRS